MLRQDGRNQSQLRPVKITKLFESLLERFRINRGWRHEEFARPQLEEKDRAFKKDSGEGYRLLSMLTLEPQESNQRDISNKLNGRSQEIQRLIGRSLQNGC